jgi:predicted nucleotidyltransferase
MNLSEMQINTIIQHVSHTLGAHTIILFGSAAQGKLREDSDIDVAYISDSTHSSYNIFMAAQGLADRLKREVDLVNFREASTVFKAQVLGGGSLLLDERPTERQYAFMRALKAYTLLNEERRPIMENLGYIGGHRDEFRRNRKQNGDDQALHSENP